MRIGRDLEAELAAHREHRRVVAQDLTLDHLQAFGAGILDHRHGRFCWVRPIGTG